MATPQGIQEALGKVSDQASFVKELLRNALGWPVDVGVEEISYEWSAGDLKADGLDKQVVDGKAWQIQPMAAGQPWGIFLLEFKREDVFTKGRGMTGPLRKVLRALVPRKRESANAAEKKTWNQENLLFICTHEYKHFRFAYFKAPREAGKAAPLAAFGWEPGDTHVRTLCEFNLPALAFPEDGGADGEQWLEAWRGAFDVERVTKEFFKQYHKVFESVEGAAKDVPSGEPRRLYTQRLFNRLMFLYFVQKKGWLEFNGSKRYLRALFDAAKDEDFLNDRLYFAFFYGLGGPVGEDGGKGDKKLQAKRGIVPFLNGGLFDLSEDGYDALDKVRIPNERFEEILHLFERHNFTISESTPLDIEVAVDPEMLGKVFEELVTGRHESGSYYTPRPIVSYMCRESLKSYLHRLADGQAEQVALDAFVDRGDASSLPNPERVLESLRSVKVCDPACGSGAYLLGMMQELIRLRSALFESKSLDAKDTYQRKLEIIQNNLYGVDLDPFAVSVAMLRLWLSLAVEFQGAKPPPLPNLDFKIAQGDSLTGVNPCEQDDMFRDIIHKYASKLVHLKEKYQLVHGPKKAKTRRDIEACRAQLADHLGRVKMPKGAFDWRVEFAEVFDRRGGYQSTMAGEFAFANQLDAQQTFVESHGGEGGFDIVLANPPYLRAEVVKHMFGDKYKDGLVKMFPEAYVKTADIYTAFYARAHQLLCPKGAACFISSNKWLRAGYGEKLRRHLLDKQAFRLVLDFKDQPVFESAIAYPCIFLWQKTPRAEAPTRWAEVGNLDQCYAEGVSEHVARIARIVPASFFGEGKPRLATTDSADRQAKMEKAGPCLKDLLKGQILYGVKTGLNEAFIIDRETRHRLIGDDKHSAEIIKPLVVGDDVRRYETHFREKHLIWTYIGVPIKNYPAIFSHLKKFQKDAEKRYDQGEHWWELRACAYYDAFEKPKIIYPIISTEPHFVLDNEGQYFFNDKVFMLPGANWYLLGVLNSAAVRTWVQDNFSPLMGGFYEFRGAHMERLPIPAPPAAARQAVAHLAQQAQVLHIRRRQRVERFLESVDLAPGDSSEKNRLEQPWSLSAEEFARKAKGRPAKLHAAARDETTALTEEIERVEKEIDERVAALYGL
jgi:hypothetical protein